MGVFEGLALGFAEALRFDNLLLILLGSFLGTWLGMLPGIGPPAAIAILLPFTYGMDPGSALIMLCGLYYGCMYGGSISSILINTPGDASSVMTAIDGNPMAQKGRAGAALLISAVCSWVGGTIALVGLSVLAVPIARAALSFGPAEYFAMITLALVATASLVRGNAIKGLISLMLGLLIASVGTDLQSGVPRFTMGQIGLMDGIPLIIVIIGVFAVSEALINIERMITGSHSTMPPTGKLWATREEWLRSRWAMLRGAVIGFVLGVLPGAGGSVATIMAYSNEVRIAKKNREEFGKGAVEGVAAPEAANNASVPGALIPLLSLGIPGSGTTAVLLGAFLLYGLQPGPRFFIEYPTIAWGLIASLYVGNIVLLILNVPFIGLFVQLLKIPKEMLGAIIMLIALTGAYAIANSLFDVGMAIFFGVIGYFMKKANVPAAPLILGVVLGGMLEQSMRQTLSLSGGDWSVFLTRPVAATLLFIALLSLIAPLISEYFFQNEPRKKNSTQ